MAAFYEMVSTADEHRRHPQAPPTSFLAARATKQPDLAIALIDLLEHEDAVVAAAAPGSLSGGYLGGYYTDLLVTVARMHDPRSLNALLPGLGISGVIRTTVSGFGEAAVAPVVHTVRSTDRDVRLGAVLTMRQLLADRAIRPLSDGAVRALRDALLGIVAGREDASIRVSAVEALMPLSDEGIRAQMEHIVATDTTTGYAPPGQPTPHPVRAAAKKWLARHP
ncbi:MAG TPA: hypothetical protein VFW98_00895 [Gemmatimonadaceae bacterium]|nr:hypothetical protein [Gemmatimonadaceae bacterium]